MEDIRTRLLNILDSEWKKVANNGEAFIDEDEIIKLIEDVAKEAFEAGTWIEFGSRMERHEGDVDNHLDEWIRENIK